MITYVLQPEVLGRTRFAFSPLSEATLSLRRLIQPHPIDPHSPWLREVRGRLAQVDLSLLLAVLPAGPLIVNFLMPTAPGPRATIESQLTDLTHVAPQQLHDDLTEVWAGRTLPRRAVELLDAGAAGPGMLAEALWDYWDAAIAPYWPRMCAVLEDDVAYRSMTLVNDGLYSLLPGLHSELALDGDRLQVNKPHLGDHTLHASAMTLTPSVFAWPYLILEDATLGEFGLTYPARGVGLVWEDLDAASAGSDGQLAALLGRTRAAVLERAAVPISTTRLAAELGQSPGSVSQHLAVLKATGLLTSWRSGRSVLYRQTPLAQTMVAAQRGVESSSRRRGAR